MMKQATKPMPVMAWMIFCVRRGSAPGPDFSRRSNNAGLTRAIASVETMEPSVKSAI